MISFSTYIIKSNEFFCTLTSDLWQLTLTPLICFFPLLYFIIHHCTMTSFQVNGALIRFKFGQRPTSSGCHPIQLK
jgi:hypothetical protein